MSQFLDINAWNRKAHYLHFKEFDDPFYNMSAEVDVTAALNYSQKNQLSFFHVCLFLANSAANQVKEFRYRVRDEKVWVHDHIHPSCTLLNDDNTFSFCDFFHMETFSDFDKKAQNAKQTAKLPDLSDRTEKPRDDVIYFSVIPWISFKTFTHPKQGGPINAIPRIGIGKYFSSDAQVKMPISLEVNHMFIDGYQLGQFFQILQDLLDSPEISLG
jgi:chloramphenicol O-acetyltransferase type A